jgi:RecA/RadA recombinase
MAPKNKEVIKEDSEVISPQSQALAYLKENKKDHYNFEEEIYYKVPSSSLNLNLELGSGLPNGAHRFMGITAGGKTSCALDFMYNFLKLDSSNRGVYFKCEGRLSPEVRARSGIDFVTDAEKWQNNCLVVESNIYEVVFGFIRSLIIDNPTKAKYFFIIDSVDSMVKRDDLSKPLEEAQQVAGGALITSVFLKKTALALARRGHICIFISQIREEIKINQYQATTQRQGKSSGGHALEHASSVVINFLGRYNDDIIRENPSDKNSKAIGHRCKIKIIKSDNENYNELSYPVKYGRVGGKSVWKELECIDMLQAWSQLKRKGDKGAWFYLDENILKELKEIDAECPEKFQGIDNVRNYLEDRPNITEYLCNKYNSVLSK